MQMSKLFLFIFLAAAPLPARAQTSTPAEVMKLLDYDKSKPLDIQEGKTYDRDGGVKVIELTYASPVQGRVPAFLVVPPGKGPFAGIVFGHWGGGVKTEFLPEAELYAQAGAVSVLIDYPWVRPAPWYRGIPNMEKPEEDLATYAQAVVDLRRAFDLLLARPDVDPKRMAYVGHSYGAQWGAILSAVDRRMKATVLVGGTPGLAAIWLDNDDPALQQFKQGIGQQKLEKYIEVNGQFDAIHFVGKASPIPLFFQFARFEQYFKEPAMKRYFEAAGQPKEIRWYDTGHDLNDIQCLLDRAAFLEKQIGLRRVAPLISKKF